MTEETTSTETEELNWYSSLVDNFSKGLSSVGSNAAKYFTSPEGIVKLGSMGLGYLGAMGSDTPAPVPTGYQGGIPALRAVRGEVPMMRGELASNGSVRPLDSAGAASGVPSSRMVDMAYDPNRRPGSSGRRYFSDTQYVGEDQDLEAAEALRDEQLNTLAERNINSPARELRQPPVQQMATGGIAGLKRGAYLNGDTDGMADKVPATIGGRQPAALSDGEFVIPADVVSHLGNGNSSAGAKVLEAMMARVRKARTGRKEQGKQVNPNKLLPV